MGKIILSLRLLYKVIKQFGKVDDFKKRNFLYHENVQNLQLNSYQRDFFAKIVVSGQLEFLELILFSNF